MSLVERAKSVCLSPDSAWATIAAEHAEAPTLIVGYVLPLAGAAAVAQAIGLAVIGQSFGAFGTYRLPFGSAIGMAVASVVFAAVFVVVLSMIIDALAPTFGAEKNREQALKVAVYSATPAWIAGVLQIVPALGVLALVGALYALYLLYLGLPRLMKSPADKTIGYLGAVIACAVVIGIVGSMLMASISSPDLSAAVLP
jgi:Yip1-like protein